MKIRRIVAMIRGRNRKLYFRRVQFHEKDSKIFIILALVTTLVISENRPALASTSGNTRSSSATVYGSNGVRHELELFYFCDMSYYGWHAECTHFAGDIYMFGHNCYCNCTIEQDGWIIEQTGRCHATYVDNTTYYSKTHTIYDSDNRYRGHAYCGTEGC